jgi:hypothetical protein
MVLGPFFKRPRIRMGYIVSLSVQTSRLGRSLGLVSYNISNLARKNRMIITAGSCLFTLKAGIHNADNLYSFLWDAAEARFLDQAILQQPGPNQGPQCPCCAFNDRCNRDTVHESFIHSETFGEVQGIEYHKDDFVYIAAKLDHPYLIGQICRFIVDQDLTVQNSKVELTLLGRFDDVARAMKGSGTQQDEVRYIHGKGRVVDVPFVQARLFLTEEVKAFSLFLIEGKCFVDSKDSVISQDLADHFYVDRWAPSLNVRNLEDLSPIKHSKLAVCKSCVHAAKQEQENARAYKTCNAPLKTMELFAGKFILLKFFAALLIVQSCCAYRRGWSLNRTRTK